MQTLIKNENIFLDDQAWKNYWYEKYNENKKKNKVICSRCLYDEDTPAIKFDENGVCNYCKTIEELEQQYPSGDTGWTKMKELASIIKKENRRKKYDVVVGVSGGCDSSYLIILAKELGLRPLAVHYDNTWNSTKAVENIRNVLDKLDVELWTYVVDNEEYDDLYRSFLKAGTPDLDSATDIGLAKTLNMAAEKYGTKYIFEGHSFRTEGISPLGWLYMDGKYIQSIQKAFGTRKLKSFPNLTLPSMLKSMILYKTKKIRPLWYINHNKEETKKMLEREFGWQWYGGHHLENRMTNFHHTYFVPRRFGIDQRSNGFSALIRSGQMTREEGFELMSHPPMSDPEIVEIIKKRLGLPDEEFLKLMTLPIKTYKDYETYKPTFEKMRPFFYLMAKMDLIPMSFYLKYTSKSEI